MHKILHSGTCFTLPKDCEMEYTAKLYNTLTVFM